MILRRTGSDVQSWGSWLRLVLRRTWNSVLKVGLNKLNYALSLTLQRLPVSGQAQYLLPVHLHLQMKSQLL